MQSEPRKIHMPILRWSSPVVPMFGSWMACVAVWSAMSVAKLLVPGGRAVVLHREAVHAEQGEEPSDDDLVRAHEQTGNHDGHRQGQRERPVRRRRHVDGGDVLGGRRPWPRRGLAP